MEMIQNGFELIVGIDVSKAKLDIAMGSSKHEPIKNNAVSIKQFIAAKITQRDRTLVVVEATGGYETLLVETLQAASVPVAVLVACETSPKELGST